MLNNKTILITGGIAYDKGFVQMIEKKVNFIAEVIAYPGEDELLALAQGGLRVLNGIEKAKIYKKASIGTPVIVHK